ncbi:contactin, partial [Plakobranchus ocellatus]
MREDGPMHPQVRYEDHNRRLIIPKARLEDTGAYTCIVRGASSTAIKTAYLELQGKDEAWSVKGNTLNIMGVDSEHEGMYQCEARNSMGMARSSAQLRALSLPPTFTATPVASSKQAAEGGEISIACRPQAAPRANIQWERSGAEVGRVLPNGDLYLTDLTVSDSGVYTCIATNKLGEARSSCNLTVENMPVFVEKPIDKKVLVNESTSLPCRASFDRRHTENVYTWSFNNHAIDFRSGSDDWLTYSKPNAADRQDGMLYIRSARYKHEGTYTCHVTSVTGSISSSAFVRVIGPPGQPLGVHVRGARKDQTVQRELELRWLEGSGHGFATTHYIIEYRSLYADSAAWNALID